MSLQSLIQSPKLQQFVVQFACKTATRKGLTSSEADSVEEILKEKDSENFQKIEKKQQGGTFFIEAYREYTVNEMAITTPIFILNNTNILVFEPVKIGPKEYLQGAQPARYFGEIMREKNRKISNLFSKIQEVLGSSIKFQRAGKIIEFVLAPIAGTEKQSILSKIFTDCLADVGEINLLLTKYLTQNNQKFNIRAQLGFLQPNIGQPFQLNMKMDINNRNLDDSLEPTAVINIWNMADSLFDSNLEDLIVI
jgi:hypothetical protein